MFKRISILFLLVFFSCSSPVLAARHPKGHVVLYGSPGPEQTQLQEWIDSSKVPTADVRVRLYEGNCEQERPEGSPPEHIEIPGQEASVIQTCASMTEYGAIPTAYNQAIYIPHMSWHPQYPVWWWHLNVLNELGHVWDTVSKNRDRHREKFSRIYGYDPRWWWPVNTWATINTEWEKWAMAYAFCGFGMDYAQANGLITSGEYSGFGFEPTSSQYKATCRMMLNM